MTFKILKKKILLEIVLIKCLVFFFGAGRTSAKTSYMFLDTDIWKVKRFQNIDKFTNKILNLLERSTWHDDGVSDGIDTCKLPLFNKVLRRRLGQN